jgi:hypothetical protein
MFNLFTSKGESSLTVKEEQLREDIHRRAMIKNEATKLAKNIVATEQKKAAKVKVVSKADALQMIDQVLDKVGAYENAKITALTELYLALESGDTKNLIQFLKAKEPVAKVSKKSVSTWNSK